MLLLASGHQVGSSPWATTWRLHSKIYFFVHLVCEKLTDRYLLTDFDFSFRWPAALMGRNAKPVIHGYPRTTNA